MDVGLVPKSSLTDDDDEGEGEETTGDSPPSQSPTSSSKEDDPTTTNDKGDGTPCSGSKCPLEGMCRNQAGLCGVGITFCNPNNVWDNTCPEKDANVVVTPFPSESPVVSSSPTTSPTSSSSPTLSGQPSLLPTLSTSPTMSNAPTPTTRVEETNTASCNEDGSSYGVTTTSDAADNTPTNVQVQSTEISYVYALKSNNGAATTINMVSQFESELNKRLACDYSLVSSSCIPCDNDDDERRRVSTRRGRKLRFLQVPSIIALGNNNGGGGGYERSMIETVDESSMLGVSSLPKDVPDPVKGKCDE